MAHDDSRWLSCQQIIATTTFGSTQTKNNNKKQKNGHISQKFLQKQLCFLLIGASALHTVCRKIENPF